MEKIEMASVEAVRTVWRKSNHFEGFFSQKKTNKFKEMRF